MGAYATGSPLFPAGYVAGTITISAGQAGTPQQLLALIQAQLDANCPGAGYEVAVSNDINSNQTLYVGRQSALGGPLSATNYGYALTAGGARIYRSGYPGSHSPIGDLQVLFAAAGSFHVEIQ